MEQLRIAVSALDPIAVAGLTNCLASRSGVTVVSRAQPADVDVVVAACERLSARAVNMLRTLAGELGKPIVLVLSEIREVELLTAVECRVVALLPRSAVTDDRLVRAAETAAAGGVPANLLGKLVEQAEALHRERMSPDGLDDANLTPREIEVLRLMADGLDTSEIADRLRYSERTVKNVIYAVTNRLQLRNRSHAVAYAMRAGVI
ncbi:helix-turn-helix transcriptional regulator [Amycolatopsis pithecellobii]|uniref:DNA-binding response regulator n=1 Tax=Amycolatopsis pithecellobii TaxID=664692 RepID=A0A6N7YS21_9PSEU|nr:response regulator transcription factor [Amycolatopsis pithecellobii]MTD55825.1 DNA-binding response regulator [Amycolatopsis pithecellobii]